MKMDKCRIIAVLVAVFLLHGCAMLLPSAKDTTRSPWKSFDEAKASYDRIIPNQTTTGELKAHGFNLYSTPNARILNYLDIAVATQSIKKEDLNGGFQACMNAKERCRAYEFEPRFIRNRRYGNFWLDLLNFKRKTKVTGWRFKALFIVVDDVVVDKLWGGNPFIEEEKEVKNPLGPLQDAGNLVLGIIP